MSDGEQIIVAHINNAREAFKIRTLDVRKSSENTIQKTTNKLLYKHMDDFSKNPIYLGIKQKFLESFESNRATYYY